MRFTRLVFFIFILAVSSCGKKPDNKLVTLTNIDSLNVNSDDSLAMFHENDWMTFVGTNKKDQIAFSLKRDSTGIFRYRIELLRKWRGLPLDYGQLVLKIIEPKGTYIFEGGNSGCAVVLRMYGAEKVGYDYVEIERDCENNSLDITANEFEKLTYKG